LLPIRTKRSNFIYRNPRPDIPDMAVERVEPGHIRSVWALSEQERDDIVQGLNIELNIFAEPIPPVSMNVTYEESAIRMRLPVLVVERFIGDDGRWYIRMLSEFGAELGVSKPYAHMWSAWLAQRRLKRILPMLEIWPS
jgi:hypothetical protein